MLWYDYAMSKSAKNRIIDEIGWIGAFAILLAYGLTTFNAISVDSAWYHFLNLVGAIGIIVLANARHTGQTLVLESIRGVMAVGALTFLWLHSVL